ncbi:MAG: ATP-binding protein [Rhodothermales bacterium]|nr:ATP-binding protein [Rhodothermales bacterium]
MLAGCRAAARVRRCAGLLVSLAVWGFALAPAASAQALPLHEEWRWVQFKVDSGLPSNSVHALVEEADGTLWALTEAGLAWYDRFRWHAVGEGRFESLVPLPGGGLAGTLYGRLAFISQEGARILPLRYGGQPLRVDLVAPLDDGALVLATSRGLMRYDGGAARPMAMPVPPEEWTGTAVGLHRSRGGRVWLTLPRGVFYWEGTGWKEFTSVPMEFVEEHSYGGAAGVIHEDYRGLWTWRPGEAPRRAREGQTTGLMQALGLSPQGHGLAVFTDGMVLSREAGQWRVLDDQPDALDFPQVLYFQRDGDLWVGTDRGLYRFRANANRWDQWPTVPGVERPTVNALIRTADGAFWAGTGTGLLIRDPDGAVRHVDDALGEPLRGITGLAEDADGGVWVTSGSSFVGAYRWHQGAWSRVGPEDGLPSPIHRIRTDRRGRLWFLGINGRAVDPTRPEPGAFVLDGDRFVSFGEEDGMPSGRVYDFSEAPDGTFWFATLSGLSAFTDGVWRHWDDENGLREDRVFTVHAARDGRVWFGHQKSGLGYFGQDGRPAYFTTADGLVSDEIWEITEDADATLWFSSSDGLGSYRDGRFSSFGVAEGMHRPKCWPVLPLGDRVAVGTLGGSVMELRFDEAANPPPYVVISEPLTERDRVFARWKVHPFDGAIPMDHVETRFRLDDQPWSPWGTSREATLYGLTPGSHRLAVQAKGLFGQVAPEGISLAFRVAPPFYLQPLFVGGVGVLLGAIFILGFNLWFTRQRHVAEIRNREASLAEAQRVGRTGSFDLNLQTRRLTFSRELYRLLALDPSLEPLTLDVVFNQVISEENRQTLQRALQEAIRTGETTWLEYRFRRGDGVVRYAFTQGRCLYAEDGTPVRVVGTVQDVTARRQAEEAARAAHEALLTQQQREKERVEAELARAREDLVRHTRLATIGQVAASIAHELRNPLGAVRNAVYMLRRMVSAGREADLQDYLEIIDQEVVVANDIITELLAMSRARMPECQMVDLEKAVEEAFARVEEAGSVELDVVLNQRPYLVSADPGQLRQIFVNLFTNAVHAMQGEGRIGVAARTEEDYDVVTVHDTGPGVPPDQAALLFEPLYTTKARGTGLGLAICREIAERHGGTLYLDPDAEGPGACFRLYLPVAPPPGAAAPLDPPARHPTAHRTTP